MKRINTLYDLIEEAKVRTVCWAICVFAISYFLSHTSKSMWTNIPISIIILSAFRYLSYEVELRWRTQPIVRQTYLSHLEKKQLSVNDYRLSTMPTTLKWKRKIDSPPVESAIDDFINKILQDFVVDLWYSSITPDKEAPELIRMIILDALGEISGRIKEINLVDLLTRDMVDLIGNHLELYRRNQSEIGVDIMGTLSFEERDERLKRHLMDSKELHPALISPESEHKVLQRIVGGILAKVLRPHEAQCPLVRCISRELLTCLVVEPVMNFASPGYINELIEYIFLASKENRSDLHESTKAVALHNEFSVSTGNIKTEDHELKKSTTSKQSSELISDNDGKKIIVNSSEHSQPNMLHEKNVYQLQTRGADWALVLEAATQRRSQVLAPENLENMWTKGRNYKKKTAKLMKAGTSTSSTRSTLGIISSSDRPGKKELFTSASGNITCIEDNYMVHLMEGTRNDNRSNIASKYDPYTSQDQAQAREQLIDKGLFGNVCKENAMKPPRTNSSKLKRSSSTPDIETAFGDKNNESSKEVYSPNFSRNNEDPITELVSQKEGSLHAPKITCRVAGAYFENIDSKSFAVYSIAVTDTQNKSWFVERRYRNFERLHRHLKDIPNYKLQLPPKRFLSSSIDDRFVHQRCILLNKYLQDLLSIANVAEQHEVWDFLSIHSKNYSFSKSTSVMKTLAVNVDDAMDDIVRQFRRKAVTPAPPLVTSSTRNITLSLHDEESKHSSSYSNLENSSCHSDEEARDEDQSSEQVNGWHSDNELNSKSFPPRVVKRVEEAARLDHRRGKSDNFDRFTLDKLSSSKNTVAFGPLEDLVAMPSEWTPPNVSVPLLNLVDKIFQLNRRGWLRRQVFWISKQILQLVMEDAIDDWILRQIHWLRRGDVIAQGIRWVQDVLWPNGTFFIKLDRDQGSSQKPATSQTFGDKMSSFELQLEAARRASDVKKMILGGAPTALVSLIGHKQYRRCSKDIYYFLQSSICLKQLAYGLLESVLVTVFPELRELILDIHEKAHRQEV